MKEFENVCKRYTSMGKNMEGVRQAAAGKLKQAVNNWSEASQLGYAKAQYNLGLCFETGKGVIRDIKKVNHHEQSISFSLLFRYNILSFSQISQEYKTVYMMFLVLIKYCVSCILLFSLFH